MFSRLKSWLLNFLGLARIDPKVVECASEDEALAKAQFEAASLAACNVLKFTPTGSMAPLIPTWGGFGVARYQPIDKARLGTVALYNAVWNQTAPIAHRLVSRDKYGFIASGDANARSEPTYRITEQNYLGEVLTVYRWPEPANKPLVA